MLSLANQGSSDNLRKDQGAEMVAGGITNAKNDVRRCVLRQKGQRLGSSPCVLEVS